MPIELMMVKPSDFKVDQQYQRAINKGHVNRIVREFKRDELGVIIASKRDNGDFYLLDGQHRVSALLQRGDDKPVATMVHTGLSMGQEADIFTAQAKSKNIQPIDLYKAKLFAGDKETMAINKIVQDEGFEVKNDALYPAIRSPANLEEIYRQYGAERLQSVLNLVANIWHDERHAIPVSIIAGVNAFLTRYEKLYDRERFIKVIGATPHAQIDEMARTMARFINDRAYTMYGRALREIYNGKLRGESKLPTWDAALEEAVPRAAGQLRRRKAQLDERGRIPVPDVREAGAPVMERSA